MYFLVFVAGAFFGILMGLLFVALLVFLYPHQKSGQFNSSICSSYDALIADLNQKSEDYVRAVAERLAKS